MKDYGMFSDEGNQLVAKAVDRASDISGAVSDKVVYAFLKVAFDEIEELGHEEVWDTDVREHVIGEIERRSERSLSIYF